MYAPLYVHVGVKGAPELLEVGDTHGDGKLTVPSSMEDLGCSRTISYRRNMEIMSRAWIY